MHVPFFRRLLRLGIQCSAFHAFDFYSIQHGLKRITVMNDHKHGLMGVMFPLKEISCENKRKFINRIGFMYFIIYLKVQTKKMWFKLEEATELDEELFKRITSQNKKIEALFFIKLIKMSTYNGILGISYSNLVACCLWYSTQSTWLWVHARFPTKL